MGLIRLFSAKPPRRRPLASVGTEYVTYALSASCYLAPRLVSVACPIANSSCHGQPDAMVAAVYVDQSGVNAVSLFGLPLFVIGRGAAPVTRPVARSPPRTAEA